jgi:hypothetical protein
VHGGKGASPKLAALRDLEADFNLHKRAEKGQKQSSVAAGAAAEQGGRGRRFALGATLSPRGRALRLIAYTLGALAGLFGIGASLLWWRLASGPISLDLVTPWLTSAIEENFGSRHSVEVGGTVIEKDESGRTALRIRDIIVRDADGAVVASAPRAEVGISGAGLLTGHLRAASLNLVGAELSVRIETDGQVTVFAGADKRPIATAPAVAAEAIATSAEQLNPNDHSPAPPPAAQTGTAGLAAFLSWLDSLSALGLDGYELTEIGLKSGSLVVEDRRNGRRSDFQKINLSLTRPRAGEMVFSVGSDNAERPWALLARVRPIGEGRRALSFEAHKILLRDLLLCLRQGDDQVEADVPVTADLHGEMAADGSLDVASGRVLVGPGLVGDAVDPFSRVWIDRAEFNLDWDATRHSLMMPFQIVSGGNRFTLVAEAQAPQGATGDWGVSITGGTALLAPVGSADEPPLLLNRILVRGHFDGAKRRLDLEQIDIGSKDVGLAGNGGIDFSNPDPKIKLGIATRNLTYAEFKQLWPSFVNAPVRNWVLEHFYAGTVERVEIATNAPLSTMKDKGPPMPDDGISIELVAKSVTLQPLMELPAIKDADLVTRIVGRAVTVSLGKATAEISPGHRLTLSNGVFEIPDSQLHPPQARVRMRIEGPVPVAAELLASERLREFSGAPLDPATSRGTVTAQASLEFPVDLKLPKGSTTYALTADVANFAANFALDRSMASQRVEATSLRIVANNEGYQAKGDVRINGMPASVEYHKPKGNEDSDIRLQAVFDDAARSRLGFDLYGSVTGPIPVRFNGRIASSADRENRFAVDADLTQAKVDNLLPGWVKLPGKPVRANFTMITKGKAYRIEDLAVDGAGVSVKGGVEVDANGDIQSANFPVFGFAETDKVTLKADRGSDGALRAVLRGDVYDGRTFVRAILGGGSGEQKARQADNDLDLEVKIGAVIGFNGEALRGLDLRYSRRGGHVRNFSLNGKLGDTPLIGDFRGKGAGHPVIYFETKDAGALFRFTDTYPHMHGGEMWAAMDPPTAEQTPQDGQINIRDFTVRGEPQLDRVIAGVPNSPHEGVQAEFTRLRAEFTRSPGKLVIHDGVVRGPVIGATIDGLIDYDANDVHLRGTFVPLYGLNNAFGQIPIVGIFLGNGSNEGLFGITYEVVGPPGRSILRVNPASVLAPGLLRKFFEFPSVGAEHIPAPDLSR